MIYASALVAIAVLLCAHPLRGEPALALLTVLLGLAPLVIALLGRGRLDGAAIGGRTRLQTRAALVGGATLAVAGAAWSVKTDALLLLQLDFPLTQVVTNAAPRAAPVGLAVAGLLLMFAGAVLPTGIRYARLLVAGLVVLLTAGTGLGLLAFAFQPLSYIGGTVQRVPVAAAGALAVAAGLLLVQTVRLDLLTAGPGPVGAGPPAASPVPPGTAGPSRRTRSGVLGLVVLAVVAVAAALAWPTKQIREQFETADLFTDQSLAACVAAEIGPETSQRELDGVLTLNCVGDTVPGRGHIQTLEGIASLPNLVGLDLSQNAVADVAPLAGTPKVTTLRLTNNDLTDIGGLAALPGLTDLGLSGNTISDLTSVGTLTGLRFLGLGSNRIDDLGPLAGLVGLEELDAGRNRIDDVRPLARLTALTRLVLDGNRIKDPAVLQRLPALDVLDLQRNRVADARTVAGCPAVTELWLGENPIDDLRPLLRMPALEGVDVAGLNDARGIPALRAKGVYVGGLA